MFLKIDLRIDDKFHDKINQFYDYNQIYKNSVIGNDWEHSFIQTDLKHHIPK
jgi:hypothetical protein